MRRGIRGWTMYGSGILGTPDFVFSRARAAVFVDGCFWHGCSRCYRRPHSNQAYWDSKVLQNRIRDRKVTRQLKRDGWRVLRFWEHTVQAQLGRVADCIEASVKSR